MLDEPRNPNADIQDALRRRWLLSARMSIEIIREFHKAYGYDEAPPPAQATQKSLDGERSGPFG